MFDYRSHLKFKFGFAVLMMRGHLKSKLRMNKPCKQRLFVCDVERGCIKVHRSVADVRGIYIFPFILSCGNEYTVQFCAFSTHI